MNGFNVVWAQFLSVWVLGTGEMVQEVPTSLALAEGLSLVPRSDGSQLLITLTPRGSDVPVLLGHPHCCAHAYTCMQLKRQEVFFEVSGNPSVHKRILP